LFRLLKNGRRKYFHLEADPSHQVCVVFTFDDLAVLIALLIVHQPWAARLMQVALILGALEWVDTSDTSQSCRSS
jgi:hypothetical protein